jgi:hypothetical protein
MEKPEGFSGMRLLTTFQTEHSAHGQFILLHASFQDTLALTPSAPPTHYPNQKVMIRLNEAKALIAELQKRVQYIEAGLEGAGTTFIN